VQSLGAIVEAKYSGGRHLTMAAGWQPVLRVSQAEGAVFNPPCGCPADLTTH
jgi:hypothetical protein